jgi:uncharacterized membrane protein
METNTRVAGHSLHPMLVVFPLGLLGSSLIWDIAWLASGNLMWGMIAFWTIVAGIGFGLVAAVPGLLDWLKLPRGTRAKRVGRLHMILNVGVLALFGLSVGLRYAAGYSDPRALEMLPGWLGLALSLLSGWLGGELVERMGVGVTRGAHLDAPSSFRDHPV